MLNWCFVVCLEWVFCLVQVDCLQCFDCCILSGLGVWLLHCSFVEFWLIMIWLFCFGICVFGFGFVWLSVW